MKNIALSAVDGSNLYPFDPKRSKISIETIATGLSNICRYGGQVKDFYSVAQHSELVSHIVPLRFAMWGLLHDAAEVWIGDIPAPLRNGMGWIHDSVFYPIDAVESHILDYVAETFGLEPGIPQTVLTVDLEIRSSEQAGFLSPWTPSESYSMFLNRFNELN